MNILNNLMSQGLLLDDNVNMNQTTTNTNPFELIGKYLIGIGKNIAPYAYSAAIIVVIVLGITLMFGGSRAREQVKGHFKVIIVGLVIVIGAPTIAEWFNGQASSAFSGNKGFGQTIQPLIDYLKFKL